MSASKKINDKAIVNLNTNELKSFVNHIIDNNRHLQKNGKIPVAINIEGPAGIGKTSTILQIAKEKGLEYIKLSLSQIEEIGDLVGFPIKEFKVTKDEIEEWIPESLINTYIEQGYEFHSISRMSHAAPSWITGKGEGGILVLDDYSRADSRFLQACMEIIDRQEYISWKLPKDWHVVLTTNPDDGEYHVTAMDEAQKTRFISVNLKFDIKTWANWAENNDIDTRCINFMLMYPEISNEKTNARSITTFFNSISSIKSFIDHLPMIQMIGEGCVGTKITSLFTSYIHNSLDKIITPDTILFNDDWDYVKKEMLSVIRDGGRYRAEIAGTFLIRLINYTLKYAETHTVKDDLIKRLEQIVMDPDIFTNDMIYILVRNIINGNRVKFQKLIINPKVAQIALK